MKADQASATARLIAAATVMCARDKSTANLVAPGAAAWCEEFLSRSRADRWLRASARWPVTRAGWRLLERATHPGIVRHWMARKKWIESRVRAAIADGISQVVVLGAGLDSLGVRLAAEHPHVRVVEIDHPATLAVKRAAIEAKPGNGGSLLAEADFAAHPDGPAELPAGVIDADRATIFLAEGLLMYLPEHRVKSLLSALAKSTKRDSRLVFSFMVERANAEIGFEPRSPLVSWWLGVKDERFLWSLGPTNAEAFVRDLGWTITTRADSATLESLDASSGKNRPMARGEEAIEAALIA